MADLDDEEIVEPPEAPVRSQEVEKAKKDITERCRLAGLALEEEPSWRDDGGPMLKLGIRCGREARWIHFGSDKRIVNLSSIAFEKYVFLSGYDAICSYQDGSVEAAVSSIGPPGFGFRRLFSEGDGSFDFDSIKLAGGKRNRVPSRWRETNFCLTVAALAEKLKSKKLAVSAPNEREPRVRIHSAPPSSSFIMLPQLRQLGSARLRTDDGFLARGRSHAGARGRATVLAGSLLLNPTQFEPSWW
jgi:hypothetical protein